MLSNIKYVMVLKLSEAVLNKTYKVVSVLGDDNISTRLKELGFIKDTQVILTHSSILGGTKIANIRGYYLCLKKSALLKVLVRE